MRSRARGLALLLAAGVLAALGGFLAVARAADEKSEEIVLRTEADDARAGAKAAEEVGGAIGLLDDPELERYVESLGERLLRHAPRRDFDYHFQVVDEDAPNAFALPGGYVYVSRGLLVLTNSEAELANVIGHEITHVAARHAAARQAVIRGVPGPLQFFAMGDVASYSRDQEREADRLGQGIAGLAGFDPGGMADFLRRLELSERLQHGGSRLPHFLDTHPSTSERVAAAAARAGQVQWDRGQGGDDRERYLRRLEGLVVGTAATEGVFRGERFVHPVLDFTMTFPSGWEVQNTRRAVGARSRQHDAVVFLEFDSEGSDPRAAAERYLEEAASHGLRPERALPVKLAGSEAWRAEGRAGNAAGSLDVMITWIAYQGTVYRVTGVSVRGGYEGTFRNVARSFRPLPPSLRRGIREQRLALVEAREGEDLVSLGRRSGNRWDIQQTAVANGLFADARLEAGTLVKIAVERDWRPPAE